ncbi:MAG: hypothetical protein P8I94_08175, partial [Emcibacteraceae bacterium]|nr:hypothetical protein [Emcibacteraceae bacterium]
KDLNVQINLTTYSYVTYYATYEVDSNMDIVTHKRIAHLNNASVMDVERSYVFKDDLLILSPLVANLRLTWKRIYKP